MRPITPEELRAWCAQARRKPVPLSEAIEMLQRAADALETADNFAEEMRQRGDS